jgi:RNA polymerase sigma-70 factor (ECF subfamily)
MTDAPDDAALVARVVGGDHDAFTTLMRRHEERIFAVCLRLMGNRAAALDATQETFLALYRKAGQYRATAAVGTWLYRIAINNCYDLLRREKRRPAEAMPDFFDPADRTAEDPFTSVELRPSIEAALQELSPDFRTVVVLADIQGASLPEVAEALQVPMGTVKSRLFRARRQLGARLGNLSIDSDHQTREDHDGY